MGCGASKEVPASTPRPGDQPKKEDVKTTKHAAEETVTRPNYHRQRSVAFEISLSGGDKDESEIDKILRRPLPPRLKRLEPLENAPALTAEQLQEKQKKAEEKRKRLLQRRRESGQSISKRQRDLIKAKEVAEQQTQAVGDEQIRHKISSADRNRELRLQEIQDKQRIREMRAQKNREKAKKIKEIDELVDYEIERYETNPDNGNDSDDSWLGDDNRNHSGNTDSRKSSGQDKRLSSGYSSRDASASTQCSNGPTRISSGKTEVTLVEVGGGTVVDADDFFDY